MMTSNFDKKNIYAWAYLLIPLGLYCLVLSLDIPDWIGLAVRHDFIVAILILSGLYLLFSSLSQPWRKVAILSLILISCTLPLKGLWKSGLSDGSMIAGLLPYSDAHGYYDDAEGLLLGEQFSHFSSRRPLYASFHAFIMGITDENLALTLALFTGLNAICMYIAVGAVQKSHGLIPSLLFFVLSFLFYRRFTGVTLTENLGFALANLGFAAIWEGALYHRLEILVSGLLALSLALNSRAGAFFVLPTILLWSVFWMKYSAHTPMWKTAMATSLSIIAGFLINSFVLANVGSTTRGFSNFSFTLYGLVANGNWTTVYEDHPEIKKLAEPELSNTVYKLAIDRIKESPLSLIQGSLRAWKDLALSTSGYFSFIKIYSLDSTKVKNFQELLSLKPYVAFHLLCVHGIYFSLSILSLVSFYFLFRNYLHPTNSLLLSATLGIVLSTPFVPPWDAGIMRAYAATIPFMAVLPAIGVFYLIQSFVPRWKDRLIQETSASDYSSTPLLIGSAVFVVLLLIGPFCVKGNRSEYLVNTSSEGSDTLVVNIQPGGFVSIGVPAQLQSSLLPTIDRQDYENGLQYFGRGYPTEANDLKILPESASLFYARFLQRKSSVFLVVAPEMLPDKKGRYLVEYEKLPTQSLEILQATKLIPMKPR